MANFDRITLLCVLASCSCVAQRPSKPDKTPVLLVANQQDHSLSLIDPVAGRQIAAIDLHAVTGHEVAVSPDGRKAYVPIYGDSGVGRAGTDGSEMLVIDLQTRSISGHVDFGHGVRPHLPVYNPHDHLLYVTTELEKAITLIDPETLRIVGSIPTTQSQSHMFALSHDGRRAYTANVNPGTVSVLDLQARKTIAVIPIAATTQRIAISNDDRYVFTADQTSPRLVVIDTKTNAIANTITLPAIGYGAAPTPDGRWLLLALRPTHQVAVIDLQTMSVARTVDVPPTPTEILVRPDGKMAYAACGEKVAAIDLSTWKLAGSIDAGKGADGMAWAQ